MTNAILLALGAYAMVTILVSIAILEDVPPGDTPLLNFALVVVLSVLWPIGLVYEVCYEVYILWNRRSK